MHSNNQPVQVRSFQALWICRGARGAPSFRDALARPDGPKDVDAEAVCSHRSVTRPMHAVAGRLRKGCRVAIGCHHWLMIAMFAAMGSHTFDDRLLEYLDQPTVDLDEFWDEYAIFLSLIHI